jgi:solute carrier family 8 (sodium/calcium exchanger)
MMLHYCCITWKLIAAFLIPPPRLGGGMPCFFACVVVMAGEIYVVSNLATMFGCAVGMSDLMTGLTLLAIGSNLPSAFGSLQARPCGSSAPRDVVMLCLALV